MNALPIELIERIALALPSLQHAAPMACANRACRDAVAGVARAFFPAFDADGWAREPAAPCVRVHPGESIAAAIARCPEGGAVRLMPGIYARQRVELNRNVHLFARDATVWDDDDDLKGVLACRARAASVTGIVVISHSMRALVVNRSAARLQRCTFISDEEVAFVKESAARMRACTFTTFNALTANVSLYVLGASDEPTVLEECSVDNAAALIDAHVVLARCRIHSRHPDCVYLGNARGRLEGNVIQGGTWGVNHDPDHARSEIAFVGNTFVGNRGVAPD